MREFYKNISDALAMLDGLEKDLNLLANDKYLQELKIDPEIAQNIVSKLKFSNKVFSEGIQNTLIKNFSKKKAS